MAAWLQPLRLEAPVSNMSCASVTLDIFHALSVWSNADAP